MIQVTPDHREQYRYKLHNESDILLRQYVDEHRIADDDTLADLIEIDGRFRLRNGESIELREYLDCIPKAFGYEVSIDAAIDMTLRSLSGSDRPSIEAVETLLTNYPQFAKQIRTAAQLGLAIWPTENVSLDGQQQPLQLPCDLGPKLPDGTKQYRLLSLAGSGAWAHTYLGVDRALSDQDKPALVAIKVYAGHLDNEWALREFADEATKARRVEHPNVIRALQRGQTEDGLEYIVFEYVEGGDLQRYVDVQNTRLPIQEAVRLTIQIAHGVQAIHSAGLVHRDIKPSNIVLTEDGQPKITDLGIARRKGGHDDPTWDCLDSNELPMGSLAFMAPEQFSIELSANGPPVDLFALGVVFYWLITGKLPYGQTAEEITTAYERGRPPSLFDLRLNRSVDQDLVNIIGKALAPNPSDRYFSAGDFAIDLSRWLRFETIPWTQPTKLRALRLWTRRRPLAAVFAVVLIVGSILGTLIAWRLTLSIQAEAETRLRLAAAMQPMRDSYLNRPWDGEIGANLWLVWVTEWLYGPTTLGDPTTINQLLNDKIGIARRHSQALETNGLGKSLERHQWDTLRAFWLIDAGRLEESESLLDQTVQPYWQRVLDASDPIFSMIEAMHAAIDADRLLDAAASSKSQKVMEQARQVVSRLEDVLDRVTLYEGNAKPLTSFIHARLEVLYGPDWLDQPSKIETLDRNRELPQSSLAY